MRYSDSMKRLIRTGIFRVSSILLLITLTTAPRASETPHCVTLEHSSLTEQAGDEPPFPAINHALSHDKKHIASYQHFDSDQRAVFKLWDTQTGKLIQSKTANHFEERSHQTRLHFSPQDQFVYMKGMSDGIPFWHLESDHFIRSTCETGMGVAEIQFNNDETVVFSDTFDRFQSLCYTRKTQALVNLPQVGGGAFLFAPKEKHLYANFVVTKESEYQALLTVLDNGNNPHVSLYRAPLDKPPYDPDSTDSFDTLILGTPPQHRVLIAKSEGAALKLEYWDYQQTPAKPLYQHTLHIPELGASAINIAPYESFRKSPDEQFAAFLSKSGLLAVFAIQSGKLQWKTQLPIRHDEHDTYNYAFSRHLKKGKSTPLAIEQDAPNALLLFDWQTGKQRTLSIPETFGSIQKRYDNYLLIESAYENGERLSENILLLDWQTGTQRIITPPKNMSLSIFNQHIPNRPELLFTSKWHRSNAKAMWLYNWQKHTSQHFELPFLENNNWGFTYLNLAKGQHALFSTRHFQHTERDHLHLYNMDTKKHQALLAVDHLLETWRNDDETTDPELRTLTYDQQKQQTRFCHFSLQGI